MSDDTMTAIAELDRLLNEPPCNEDKMGVREYRHLVYPAFQRLVAYIERQAAGAG